MRYYYSKCLEFYKLYGRKGLIRKTINTIFRWLPAHPLRRIRSIIFLDNSSVRIGKNVIFKGMSYKLMLNNNIVFYDHAILEFGTKSEIRIGNNCLFSYGVLLAINLKLDIGENVQIGEYSSIRDTTHIYNKVNLPIKYSGDLSEGITIGNDVWIGRGCLIQPGTVIEDGVIVAANSVVKGRLEKNKIYGGIPAKYIKDRF